MQETSSSHPDPRWEAEFTLFPNDLPGKCGSRFLQNLFNLKYKTLDQENRLVFICFFKKKIREHLILRD